LASLWAISIIELSCGHEAVGDHSHVITNELFDASIVVIVLISCCAINVFCISLFGGFDFEIEVTRAPPNRN
jgi:hypothetical protein